MADDNLWVPEGNEEGLQNLWRMGKRNRNEVAGIEPYTE